jgi:hypothetical protein
MCAGQLTSSRVLGLIDIDFLGSGEVAVSVVLRRHHGEEGQVVWRGQEGVQS